LDHESELLGVPGKFSQQPGSLRETAIPGMHRTIWFGTKSFREKSAPQQAGGKLTRSAMKTQAIHRRYSIF
jgi:hypothetical protein